MSAETIATALVRLDLAVAKNRRAGEALSVAIGAQRSATDRLRLAVADLRANSQRHPKDDE